jgi:hypothetical protein
MAKDLIQEAYAQVDAMRDAATETAKNILIEAMSTDLKAAVAQAMNDTIGEEETEVSEELVEETDVVDADENVEEPLEVNEGDINEEEEEVVVEDMDMEDDDEDDEEDEDEDDEEVDEEDMEEMMDEEVINVVEDASSDETETVEEGDELSQLKAENAALRQENKKYEKALIGVKKQMDEINLFNARLAAATDIMRTVPLTKGQKEGIVENFDGAKSLGEVKRLHKILKETYNSTENNVRKARVSRPNVQSVVTENKDTNTDSDSAYERLSILAGV